MNVEMWKCENVKMWKCENSQDQSSTINEASFILEDRPSEFSHLSHLSHFHILHYHILFLN